MRISDWSSDVCSSDLLDPFSLSASAQLVYADRADAVDPQLSGMVSWKNAAETFGILLGGIYQKRQTRRDGIEVRGYPPPGGAAGTHGVPTLLGSPLYPPERDPYGANRSECSAGGKKWG